MATKNTTSAKKKTAARSGTKKQREMEELRKRQDRLRIVSIITFTLSVALFCIAIVPGKGLWEWCHNAYMGLFGFGAYLLPFVSVAVAIICNFDQKRFSLAAKAIETLVLILFICSFVHVCKYQQGGQYGETLKLAYNEATNVINGGLFGALFGELFLSFGKTAAVITNILLVFVTFMILSGFTLIQFFQSIWKPVKKTQEQIVPVIEQRLEERRTRRFNVDIPLGPDEAEPAVKRNNKKEKEIPKGFADPEDAPKRRKQTTVVAETDTSDIIALFHPDQIERNQEASHLADTAPLDDIIRKAAEETAKKKPVAAHQIIKKAESSPEEKAQQKPVAPMEIPQEAMEREALDYKFPSIELLRQAKAADRGDVSDELKTNAEKLVDTLRSFGVETKITDICRGPTVTRYELKPSAGVKISKITNLSDDIALNLAASGVRIEAPIPNKAAVGIEVPNKISNTVSMREIIDTSSFRSAKSKLTAGLGKDITGNCIYCDIAKMPHLLIAGATGAGKSVCMNSIIVSILYKAKPDEVKFLMIDPKKVEFAMYSGIPHLLVPVVTDPRKAAGALGWAVSEMLQRYKMFVDSGVKDITGYNKMAESMEDMKPMPQVVIFIDELADLMMAAPNEVEDSICRLAQMARAAGMHLVIATQRPSVDVITGIIKANIPSRIALTVSSQVDSRTILDSAGAEKLLGRGDMLYSPVGLGKPVRVQGCFVTEEEIEDLISFIKSQGESNYDEQISKEIEEKAVQEKKKSGSAFDSTEDGDDTDPLLANAVEIVLELGSASTSVLQRKLKVGYARGARIVDQLEEKGIVGPPEGSKPRKVLITKQQWLEMCANSSGSGETVEQISFQEEARNETMEEEME